MNRQELITTFERMIAASDAKTEMDVVAAFVMDGPAGPNEGLCVEAFHPGIVDYSETDDSTRLVFTPIAKDPGAASEQDQDPWEATGYDFEFSSLARTAEEGADLLLTTLARYGTNVDFL